jgi:hypothetical protein
MVFITASEILEESSQSSQYEEIADLRPSEISPIKK